MMAFLINSYLFMGYIFDVDVDVDLKMGGYIYFSSKYFNLLLNESLSK